MMILYLIALVSVVGATAPATITPPPADCFTKYKCVMPKNCLAGAPLIDVEDTSDFKPDCFVFLKFHPFSPNWYRIIMRSVVDTAKIEFTYKHGLTEEHVFICEKDETTTPPSVKISHKKAQDTPKEVDVIKHELTNSFTCEFDADLRGETLAADFTLTKATATVHSSLPSSAPKKTDPRTVEMNLYYCMPSALLTPRDNFKSDLRYAKMQHNWEDDSRLVFCENSHLYNSMEYRPEGTDKYQALESISCENGFKIKSLGKEEFLTEDADVRCVADVEYFCDYDPKTAVGQERAALVMQKPDRSNKPPTKGHIACPADHPFFVIKGRLPVRNAEIKCRNHFGKIQWTYEGVILSETGPEVYCVKDLDCHVMNKIPRSNFKGSFMNDKFLPTCQSGGILKVGEGSPFAKKSKDLEVDNDSVNCDRSTGMYNYRIKGKSPVNVTKNTFFSCLYESSEAATAANTRSYIMIAALALLFIILIIFYSVGTVFMRRSERNMQLKMGNDVHKPDQNNSDLCNWDLQPTESKTKNEDGDDLLANDYLQKKKDEAPNIITTTLLPELPTKTANFDKLVLIKKKNDEFKGKGKRKLEKYTFPEDSEAYKDLKIQLTPAITNQFSAIMRPSQKAGATTPLSPPTPLNNVESLTPQSPPAPQPTK